MPTRVHQNIGSFWNAAEMKLHVNRTCFYTGLKSQTGMSSFRLSCEHTLSAYQCIWDNKKMHKTITIPLLCHYELFIHTCVSKNAIAPKDAIFYLIDIAWYTIRFIVILFYIERKWILMRNLAIILPLKSKLSGKFQRFNTVVESIEILKSSWTSKNCNKFEKL